MVLKYEVQCLTLNYTTLFGAGRIHALILHLHALQGPRSGAYHPKMTSLLQGQSLLQGHEGRVTDLTFNPAGKWLITSSMDSTVRTWDLLTGSLIDKLTVDQVQLPYSRVACCSMTEF